MIKKNTYLDAKELIFIDFLFCGGIPSVDIPNNDATITLISIMDDEAGIIEDADCIAGGTYTGNTDIANVTAFDDNNLLHRLGNLGNPSGIEDYTIRVFNGARDCFQDITVTLQEQEYVN